MDCKYHIDTERDFMSVTISGSLSRDSLLDALLTFNSDPRYRNTMNGIADLRGIKADLSTWDLELVCFCLRSLGKMSEAVWIIINTNQRTIALVKAYQGFARHPIEIVSTPEEANRRIDELRAFSLEREKERIN